MVPIIKNKNKVNALIEHQFEQGRKLKARVSKLSDWANSLPRLLLARTIR